MNSCTSRTGGHASLDVDTDLSGMSVVIPPRFVVQFWAPNIEKRGNVGEGLDEQAKINMQHAAILGIRHLDGGTIRRVQT